MLYRLSGSRLQLEPFPDEIERGCCGSAEIRPIRVIRVLFALITDGNFMLGDVEKCLPKMAESGIVVSKIIH